MKQFLILHRFWKRKVCGRLGWERGGGTKNANKRYSTCIIHMAVVTLICFNPIALKKTKIVYNFGLSECSKS